MDANHKPAIASMEESYTAVSTHKRGYAQPGDLQHGHKMVLNEVLYRAKTMLLGERCAAVTSQEQEGFLQDVFREWDSTKPAPEPKEPTRRLKDTCVEVAVLNEDVPTQKEIKDELKHQGKSANMIIKSRAFKHLLHENRRGVQTKNINRKRGAPVFMRAQMFDTNKISHITYLAKDGGLLPSEVKMTWLKGINSDEAHRMAYERFDLFETTRVNGYNLEVAVFMARNRIVCWASNKYANDYGARPDNEVWSSFLRVQTFRRSDGHLADLPAPTLYPGVPSTDDEN